MNSTYQRKKENKKITKNKSEKHHKYPRVQWNEFTEKNTFIFEKSEEQNVLKWKIVYKTQKGIPDGSTDKWTQMKEKKEEKSEQKSQVNQEKEKGTVNPENYIYDLWFKKRMRGTFSPSIINRWISNIFRHCEIGFFLPLSQHFNNEHIIVFSFVFFFFCSVICGSAQSAVYFMLFQPYKFVKIDVIHFVLR